MVIDLPVRPQHLYDDLPDGSRVALSMDLQSIVAYAPTLEDLQEKLQELGNPEYVFDKVPPKDMMLVL